MTALTLTRTDPAKRMARFYRTDVQPDLFGGWSLWREWGRIGQAGKVTIENFKTAGAAELAQARLLRAKVQRGYMLGRPRAMSEPGKIARDGTAA